MLSFTILPVKGLKNDVPPDDPTMFEFITESIAKTHCTDSEYVGYHNTYNGRSGAANKTGGKTLLLSTDAAITSGTMYVVGLFQSPRYNAGTTNTYIAVTNRNDEGRIYSLSSGISPDILSDGAGTENIIYKDSSALHFNPIAFAGFTIFPGGISTNSPIPQCTSGGGYLVDAEDGGSLKCMYAEFFKGRVFYARTNAAPEGEYSIRYSNLNPQLPVYVSSIDSTLSFAAANEIFYPNNEYITGIKTLTRNKLLAYADSSIAQIKYQANYATPFSIQSVQDGFGAISQDSIVTVGQTHFFYNREYGFCGFDGYSVKIISSNIQDTVDSIIPISFSIDSLGNKAYRMPGAVIKSQKEIVWTVSINGTTPSSLLYYNYITGNWRNETITMDAITTGYISVDANVKNLLMANDGDIYYHGLSTSNAGSAYAAHRIEPILNFGGENRTLINEIWVRPEATTVGEEIDIWYRGGHSVAEVEAASWTTYGAIRTDTTPTSPARTPYGLNTNNRYHQIKWGSDSTGALFSINKIEFKYVMQGRY